MGPAASARPQRGDVGPAASARPPRGVGASIPTFQVPRDVEIQIKRQDFARAKLVARLPDATPTVNLQEHDDDQPVDLTIDDADHDEVYLDVPGYELYFATKNALLPPVGESKEDLEDDEDHDLLSYEDAAEDGEGSSAPEAAASETAASETAASETASSSYESETDASEESGPSKV